MTWPAKRHKYNAQRTEVDGVSFPSKAEAEAYSHLLLWQSAGRVTKIERQPRFPFPIYAESGRPFEYRADFRVTWADGKQTVVDVKGKETDVFRIKWALMKFFYPELSLEKWRRRSGAWETE